MCCVFLYFVTFLYGVVGQVWYLIVSIPGLCLPLYFKWLQIRRHVVSSRSPNDNDFVENPIYLVIEQLLTDPLEKGNMFNQITFSDGILTHVVTRICFMYKDKA